MVGHVGIANSIIIVLVKGIWAHIHTINLNYKDSFRKC